MRRERTCARAPSSSSTSSVSCWRTPRCSIRPSGATPGAYGGRRHAAHPGGQPRPQQRTGPRRRVHPPTYRDTVFEDFTVERAGTVFDVNAPAVVPLCDATIGEVDRTFVLENVKRLVLENVEIEGQRVGGRLEWLQAEPPQVP